MRMFPCVRASDVDALSSVESDLGPCAHGIQGAWLSRDPCSLGSVMIRARYGYVVIHLVIRARSAMS
jgi:hypothetical protein